MNRNKKYLFKIKQFRNELDLRLARTADPDEKDVITEDIKFLDKLNHDAKYIPDWLIPTIRYISTTDIYKVTMVVGEKHMLVKRLIEKLKLTKYDGILAQNGEDLKETLEEQVFRELEGEVALTNFTIDQKLAKEVAFQTASKVLSPIDNREIITFKNRSLDFKKSFDKRDLVWLPERVENHNPVVWNYMTKDEIMASPKHKEQLDKMTKLFNDWRVRPKIIFKIGAYAMCKRNFADKIFFFEGKGGEGKSQVLDMIKNMFDNAASKIYDPINPSLGAEMAFVGSQIVFNDDMTNGRLNLTHIKPAATGGEINIRPLYKSVRAHRPYSTMIFNTNYGLKTGDDAVSHALDSRVFVLRFTGPDMRGTPEAQAYKRWDPINNKEFMEVFVSLCVKNMPALFEEEFNDDSSKSNNKKDSITSQNTVKKFIDDFEPTAAYYDRNANEMLPLIRTDNRTTVMELYRYFRTWSDACGFKPINKSQFSEQFEKLSGVKVSNLSASFYKGEIKRWIDLTELIEKKHEENVEEEFMASVYGSKENE